MGLDVQQRRTIQHVHMRDMEDVPVPAQQRYQAHADAARTAGGPGGEDAAFLLLPVRDGVQARGLCPVEGEEQPDTDIMFQPFEPGPNSGNISTWPVKSAAWMGCRGVWAGSVCGVWMMPMGRQVNRGSDMDTSCACFPGECHKARGWRSKEHAALVSCMKAGSTNRLGGMPRQKTYCPFVPAQC